MGGLDNTPATPAMECVTNQNSGEDYQFGDLVPDSCCQMADMHDDIESHFSNRETPCGLFPLQYQPSAFQFPLPSTAYCDSPNHVIYEEVHCQQTDERCGGCESTFSHEFHGPVCVKLTDFPGEPQKYYGWFEGCADHEDTVCCQALTADCLACSASSTVDEYCATNPLVTGCAAPTSGDEWTRVSGSYAIYGLDNTPATPATECVTNQNSGEDYQFGDLVPDSCCQMADMHDDIESHFSNREAPCGLFPLQYQPSAFQFPLPSTAYCDSPNHVIYEEVHCQQTDERCGGCVSTFSHEFHGPVCVKLTDFPGQPQKYYGWFEGCADHDDHSASLVNSHTEIRAHGDHFTSVSGSYAIYGLDNTPATPSAQCVTNENPGEDYQFGDMVPDSCCQMADMHGDIESHFSNRESPCGF